jgi:hypothetical protein
MTVLLKKKLFLTNQCEISEMKVLNVNWCLFKFRWRVANLSSASSTNKYRDVVITLTSYKMHRNTLHAYLSIQRGGMNDKF